MTIPLTKRDLVRRDGAHSLVRAVVATARGRGTSDDAVKVARAMWPDDKVVPELIRRGAASPADITTSGWAVDVATFSFADFIATMGGASSQLLPRAMQLSFGQSAAIVVPAMVASATDSTWISQGSPIPVRQLDTSGSFVITPKKMATLFVMTNEMARSANFEAYLRDAMTKSIALSVDAALLSIAAATETQPAGLRCGVDATAATSGATVDSLRIDLGNLASSVSVVSGLDVAFVAAPGAAMKIALQAGPAFEKFPVLVSNALAAKTVLCVGLNALCTALDPVPVIQFVKDATIHMDTAPAQISTGGSIATGGGVRSLWQTDSVGVKFSMSVDWSLRDSRACAWVQNVNW